MVKLQTFCSSNGGYAMKNAIKKAISLLLVAVMVFGTAPLAGFVGLELPKLNLFGTKASAATSGNCGENLTWIFDISTGKITIDGTGKMKDYASYESVPWNSYIANIKNVFIGEGVTSIGDFAFAYCKSLANVSIPDGIISIGNSAFRYCTSLTSITIPDSVTTIYNETFSCCSCLTDIAIPECLKSIGDLSFYNTGITKVEISDSLTSIGYGAFADCNMLTSISVSSANTEYSTGEHGVLFNKNKTELIQYPAGNKKTIYTIPNSVTSIGDYAFAGCYFSENIIISDSVKNIGKSAFSMSYITNLSIPDSVENIGDSAFYYCKGLMDVTIGNGITNISKYAFDQCSNLKNISIPDSVTSIGYGAFSRCESLTNITLPNSVTKIDDYAFFYCSNLTDIKIPNSVASIGNGAFTRCESLKTIAIPNRITKINKNAFFWCICIENIIIPDSVKNIEESAFSNCKNLDYVHIPASVTSIEKEILSETSAYICSTTENCYAKQYAEANGIEFRLCDGSHSIQADPDIPDTPNIPEEPYKKTITGTMENLGMTYEYEYSDEFFENSSYEYNHDLATMSICLAISAMVEKGSYNGDEPEAAKKLMEEIGYGDNLTPCNYDTEPEQDSIACIIGSKNIPETDETVIAIAIRGAGYGNEWAGNFNLGSNITHNGFKKAKNKVMSYLCSFIEENKETFNGSVKYWVTGFSRSAATANLVAAELDEIAENHEVGFVEWWNDWKTIADLNFDPSDVYAYTFETPMNTTSDDSSDNLYKNIFNIINRNDFVPRVAPSEWGYDRFGIDCMLPSAEKTDNYKDFKDRMSESYEIITDGLTYEEEFQYFEIYKNWDVWHSPVLEMRENKSMYQSAFLDEFVGILADDVIGSRETYIDKYEASVMELAKFLMGTKGYEWSFNLNDFLKNLGESIKDKWLSLAFDAFTGSHLKGVVSAALSASCGNVDLSASDIYDVLDELDGIFEGLASNFDTTYTLIVNSVKTVPTTEKQNGESRLFYTHNPAVCLAWMDAINGELIEVEFSNIKMFEDDVYRILAKLPSLPSDIIKLEEKVDYILNNPSYLLTLEERNVLEQYKQESQITRTYRKVIFNCPVNISVYDKSGALRASIVDDIVQYVPDGYISTYINPDGEKVFCLPNDGEYAFEITGTDSGMLNCSVVDFDADLRQNVTGSNYYNIPVEKGTQIAGFLEVRTSEISKSKSNFEFADGTDIPVSDVIDYTTEDEYTITVESDSKTGNVIGGGKYYIGEFAKVIAFSGENEYFAGWFINGECVSYEPEYRFMVTSNCTLTAKFYPSKEWKLDIDNSRSIIYKGEFVLTPTISPAPVNAKIVYSSSDTSVATVDDNGNVTAVGTGNAIITAKIEGTEIYDQCEVNVSYAWWQWIIRILLLGFLWY